jgi:single-strand DNA-binding protein
MSRSLNRVMLIGNVGNAPDVRTTANGNRVAAFSLATSRQWTDGSGAKQEKTEWHRCIAWNQGRYTLADIVADHVTKGAKLYVEGEIEYRRYTDKDETERTVTEIKVRELLLLGGRRDEGEPGTSAPASAQKASGQRAINRQHAKAQTGASNSGSGDDFSDFPDALLDDDDDLPF